MFLFEGTFGVYFHTGDFRLNRAMLSCPVIKRARGRVDKLFIDTTFCSPFWLAFPSKEQAISQVLGIISSSAPNTKVYLECEMLGTQDVLLAVAKKYKAKVFVSGKLKSALSCIPEIRKADILTDDPHKTCFHLLKSQRYTNKSDVALEPGALYIRPSVQWFGQQGNGRCDPAEYQTKPCYAHGIWHVLYSIHSSFEELEEFVSLLKPRQMVPLTECSPSALKILSSCLAFPDQDIQPPIHALHRNLSAPSLLTSSHRKEQELSKEKSKTRSLRRLRSATKQTERSHFCEDFIMATLATESLACSNQDELLLLGEPLNGKRQHSSKLGCQGEDTTSCAGGLDEEEQEFQRTAKRKRNDEAIQKQP